MKAFLTSFAMTKPLIYFFIMLKKKIERSTKKGEPSSPRLNTFVERNMKNNKVLTHGEKQKHLQQRNFNLLKTAHNLDPI